MNPKDRAHAKASFWLFVAGFGASMALGAVLYGASLAHRAARRVLSRD